MMNMDLPLVYPRNYSSYIHRDLTQDVLQMPYDEDVKKQKICRFGLNVICHRRVGVLVYVTGVYLRDISDTFFQVLHLNVSHLSICSSFFLV